MTTYTQLVNDMVEELLRPDKRGAICSYLNQTVREIHFKSANQAPIRFDANRFEDEFAINTDSPYIWSIPFPSAFQSVEAFYNPEFGIYVPPRNPKVTQEFSFQPYRDVYWYRSGAYIAISGLTNGGTLKATWFQFPPSLVDQSAVPDAQRVVWDPITYAYKFASGGGIPTQPEIDLAAHWMLERWEETLKQGVRAKVYAGMGDGDRARMMFSAFEAQRAGLWESEPSS